MPIPLALLGSMGAQAGTALSTVASGAGAAGAFGAAGATAAGGLAASQAAAAGGLASGLAPSTGIAGALSTNPGMQEAMQAMRGPSALSQLGQGALNVGKFGIGTQLGPLGIGPANLKALLGGDLSTLGNLNAMQTGAAVGSFMPKVSYRRGNRGEGFSFGGKGLGGGGLSKQLLMSQFLNRDSGGGGPTVNPRAQTETVRPLLEGFDVANSPFPSRGFA